MPGLQQVSDRAVPCLALSASALWSFNSWQNDLIYVEESVLFKSNVNERCLKAGDDIVNLALVDIAND